MKYFYKYAEKINNILCIFPPFDLNMYQSSLFRVTFWYFLHYLVQKDTSNANMEDALKL